MQIYKIDEEGYMIFGADKIIDPTDSVPDGYINVPLPKDTAGNQLPFYKPRWTGTEWVEDMAQEDIDAIKNAPRPKTQIEIMQETVDQLVLDALVGGA